jgi:hypothetical protein
LADHPQVGLITAAKIIIADVVKHARKKVIAILTIKINSDQFIIV